VHSNFMSKEYLMENENTIYFFSVDNSSNTNLDETRIPNKYSVGSHAYMLFKIDLEDGDFEKGVVLRPKKKDGKIVSRIMDIYPITKDEILLMRAAYDGTGNTFIRVTIK